MVNFFSKFNVKIESILVPSMVNFLSKFNVKIESILVPSMVEFSKKSFLTNSLAGR